VKCRLKETSSGVKQAEADIPVSKSGRFFPLTYKTPLTPSLLQACEILFAYVVNVLEGTGEQPLFGALKEAGGLEASTV
jgi:hypothetical protein